MAPRLAHIRPKHTPKTHPRHIYSRLTLHVHARSSRRPSNHSTPPIPASLLNYVARPFLPQTTSALERATQIPRSPTRFGHTSHPMSTRYGSHPRLLPPLAVNHRPASARPFSTASTHALASRALPARSAIVSPPRGYATCTSKVTSSARGTGACIDWGGVGARAR